MSFWAGLILGLAVNGAAAVFVLWRGSVTPGGAAAGLVVGGVIFACAGPLSWALLMAFFISSTLLSSLGAARKEGISQIHDKGSRRDAWQVLANGGVGAVCALCFRITGHPSWTLGLAVSFASSNADTWASEVGELSRRPPVFLLTRQQVSRGVSGGVTPLGTMMAAAGAVFIAVLFAAVNPFPPAFRGGFGRVVGLVSLGGFLGALLDSALGETLQAKYEVPGGGLTERPRDGDGRPRRRVRGLAFVTNDVVNVASCAAVTAAAVLIAW